MQIAQSSNGTLAMRISIKASIDEAWQALRDKEKLRRWHGWDTPGLGKEIETIYFTDKSEEGVKDDKRRVLKVNGGDTFTLQTEGQKTTVTLVRAPLSGDARWDAYYNEITEGWISFIEQLRFMLECQPLAVRRTIRISSPSSWASFIKSTGLENKKAGSGFASILAGEKVAGTVWFRSPHQLGAVVKDWGPGLIIIAETEPNGSITATLSTYDMDETTYCTLESRWKNWQLKSKYS